MTSEKSASTCVPGRILVRKPSPLVASITTLPPLSEPLRSSVPVAAPPFHCTSAETANTNSCSSSRLPPATPKSTIGDGGASCLRVSLAPMRPFSGEGLGGANDTLPSVSTVSSVCAGGENSASTSRPRSWPSGIVCGPITTASRSLMTRPAGPLVVGTSARKTTSSSRGIAAALSITGSPDSASSRCSRGKSRLPSNPLPQPKRVAAMAAGPDSQSPIAPKS